MLSKVKTLEGYKMDSLDGEIGKVKAFYFDDRHWTIRYPRLFSQVIFSIPLNTLKTGAFTDQKHQMRTRLFSLLFSLCIFEKSINKKSYCYHCSKSRLVAHRGIEPLFHWLLLCDSKSLASNPKTDDKTFNCWLSGRLELFSQEQTKEDAIPIFAATWQGVRFFSIRLT